MKNFSGRVLFLDRSDINTDEIIPAKYLTENTKQALAPHLLEDLVLDGFSPKRDTPGPISAAALPGNMPPGPWKSTESIW
jgi:3-isopropylmalate/(R)-2-methylmalate dehydratase small subunit